MGFLKYLALTSLLLVTVVQIKAQAQVYMDHIGSISCGKIVKYETNFQGHHLLTLDTEKELNARIFRVENSGSEMGIFTSAMAGKLTVCFKEGSVFHTLVSINR